MYGHCCHRVLRQFKNMYYNSYDEVWNKDKHLLTPVPSFSPVLNVSFTNLYRPGVDVKVIMSGS